jgi:hypothetical protein
MDHVLRKDVVASLERNARGTYFSGDFKASNGHTIRIDIKAWLCFWRTYGHVATLRDDLQVVCRDRHALFIALRLRIDAAPGIDEDPAALLCSVDGSLDGFVLLAGSDPQDRAVTPCTGSVVPGIAHRPPGINWFNLAAGVTCQEQKQEEKDTAD